MSEAEVMKGKLEGLEWAYGEVTHRDLITSRPDENGRGVYVFDDEAEARTLAEAVSYGRVLYGFALNLLRQSTTG